MTLNTSQKSIYELICKTIRSRGDSVTLPFVHANEIWIAFEAVLADHPGIFYTNSYQYSKDLNKRKIVFQPEYRFSDREIKNHQSTLSSSLAFFDTEQKKSNYEKVLYVHDSILHNVEYDYSTADEAHSALGITINSRAVCEGITKYVKLALDYLSVKSIVVSGRATNPAFEQYETENHAWNMVEVDGKWYHLDVTFDLTIKHRLSRYDYFLVRDEEIKRSHSTANKLPPTSTHPMDFYTKNGTTVRNINELEKLVYNAINAGQRVMQFKLLTVGNEDVPTDEVLEAVGRQCSMLLDSYSIEMRYNEALWVFEVEIK